MTVGLETNSASDHGCNEIAKGSVFAEAGSQMWGVAWTKSRCEKALAEYFTARSVCLFLPLVATRRNAGNRIRQSWLPLFPGYVFFDTAAISRPDVFASRRVAEVLCTGDEAQLRTDLMNLSLALQHDQSLREVRFGEIGCPVHIKSGSMKGLTGELVRYGSQSRLIVRIQFLGKAAELEIDEAFIA